MSESQAHNTLGDEVRKNHFLEEGAGLKIIVDKASKPTKHTALPEVDDQEIGVQDVSFVHADGPRP